MAIHIVVGHSIRSNTNTNTNISDKILVVPNNGGTKRRNINSTGGKTHNFIYRETVKTRYYV